MLIRIRIAIRWNAPSSHQSDVDACCDGWNAFMRLRGVPTSITRRDRAWVKLRAAGIRGLAAVRG